MLRPWNPLQVVSEALSPEQCREAMKARIRWADTQWIDIPIYECRKYEDIGVFSSVRARCPTMAAVEGNPDRVQASLIVAPETAADVLDACDFAARLDGDCSRWFVAVRQRPDQPSPADPLDEVGVVSQIGRTLSTEDSPDATFYCLGPEAGVTMRPKQSSLAVMHDTSPAGLNGRIATNGHRFGPFAEPIEVIDWTADRTNWLSRRDGARVEASPSVDGARKAFREMLASSESGPIASGWIFLEFSLAAYEAARATLDDFAKGWEVHVAGTLRNRVNPFAERVSLREGAPDYIPMYSWRSRRIMERHPWRVRESFACGILRKPEDLRLEFCSDTDDPERLLNFASRATGGLEFALAEPDDSRARVQ